MLHVVVHIHDLKCQEHLDFLDIFGVRQAKVNSIILMRHCISTTQDHCLLPITSYFYMYGGNRLLLKVRQLGLHLRKAKI